MHILDTIAAHKRLEVDHQKRTVEVMAMQDRPDYQKPRIAVTPRLQQKGNLGIIAEHKRRSPSRPSIKLDSDIAQIASGYERAGATAMSVLTDSHFFGGSLDDLVTARAASTLPLLRKDFIIDSYQIEEAKAYGADLILLISELLDRHQIADLGAQAQELGMQVLLEMHSAEHLPKAERYVDIVGVNNRDLKTFTTSIDHSLDIGRRLPDGMVRISESGLKTAEDIHRLLEAGFDGFLIGETFMHAEDPGEACLSFIQSIEKDLQS